MVSKIRTDQIEKSNGSPVELTGQSAAKAWCNFDGDATTITVNGSFNVSSLTDNATGKPGVNFTNAMVNSRYSLTGSASYDNNSSYGARMCPALYASESATLFTIDTAGNIYDYPVVAITVNGDLA